MAAFFHTFVYEPIYNVLIFLYNIVPGQDFGIAIILTTLLLKFVLLPLSRNQIESQKKMQELQPKMKEIQQKYKNDKEKQTRALMEFYKENKINPFAGCLPLIIQLTFLIAIYRVLINISNAGLRVQQEDLYGFVANPGQIQHLFIGLIDLSQPGYIIAALAALAQYYQTKMLMQTQAANAQPADPENPDFGQIMMKQMLYLGPILTLIFGFTFPAGLSLYWLVSTLFMIGQQTYILKTRQSA
jgi:YidC/Oxa1 family membrane protein insertase